VGNSYGQANKVWLNDGSGNFTDNGQNLGSSNSWGVALGDLDGDGDMDAFVGNSVEPNKVWLNDGSGNFNDSGQNLGGSMSDCVALADLDGDGDMDAFVGNDGANKVWLNDGTGTFTDSGQNLGSSNNYDVALNDLDGDGDIDAFLSADFGINILVWFNDGSGNFTDSLLMLVSSSGSLAGVDLADLDGDGDMDAFGVKYSGPNKVWLNDGTGNFNLSFTISSQLFTAPPFAVQFDNTTPNPSNYNFTWDFGDGIVVASNNLTVFHEYFFNGTYSITLFAEEIATGCMDTLYQEDYIYCTGGTGCTHTASITQTGPIYNAIGDSALLSCNTRPTFSYQWKRNGITIPGANDTLYYAKQDGNYTVMIIEYNCPEYSQGIDVYFNLVGLAEQPPNKLTLYPNPTTGILTIEGVEGIVAVYDIYGRLVLTTKTNTLNISHAARGIYFVRVLDEQGNVYSQKVVKD